MNYKCKCTLYVKYCATLRYKIKTLNVNVLMSKYFLYYSVSFKNKATKINVLVILKFKKKVSNI